MPVPAADHQPGALDVLDTSFRLLVTGPSPLAIDGAVLGHGLPARLIPLGELRRLLLARTTTYGARDAAVSELLRRARGGGGAWAVGLAAANGYRLGALYLRRERAEARLVGWLTTGRLPAPRAWSRPIRLRWPAGDPTPARPAPHAGGRARAVAARESRGSR